MNSLMKSLSPLLLAALFVGCVPATEKNTPDPEFCEGTSCEQTLDPEITGVFVSGHLGNYWDCPEDGYTQPVVGGSDGAAPPPGEDADFAPCMEGDDSCQNVILNCENASLTVSLSNIGEAIGEGLQVDRVELYNTSGTKVADLPVLEVTENNAAFDGQIGLDETLSLRVDFQGPANPYDLLSEPTSDGSRGIGADSGTVRVIISADNHDDVEIEGKSIYSIPGVDT